MGRKAGTAKPLNSFRHLLVRTKMSSAIYRKQRRDSHTLGRGAPGVKALSQGWGPDLLSKHIVVQLQLV